MSNDEEAAADLALADESLTELGKLVHETRLANLIAVAKGVKLSSAGSGLSAQQLLEGEGRRILIQTYRAFEDVLAEIERDEHADAYLLALQAAHPEMTTSELDEAVTLHRMLA